MEVFKPLETLNMERKEKAKNSRKASTDKENVKSQSVNENGEAVRASNT